MRFFGNHIKKKKGKKKAKKKEKRGKNENSESGLHKYIKGKTIIPFSVFSNN